MAEQFKQFDEPDINRALANWLKEENRIHRYRKAKLSVQATDDTFIAIVKLSEKEENG